MLTDEQAKAIETMAARFGGKALRALKPAPDSDPDSPEANEQVSVSQPEESLEQIATEPIQPEIVSDAKALNSQTLNVEEEHLHEGPAQSLQPQPCALSPERSRREAMDDEAWALENLRCRGDIAFNDIANVLRIFTRHRDFQGRFSFNKSMGKVIDRGEVLLGWQMDELCAAIQERFLPEITPETVHRALLICANRRIIKEY